MPVTQSTTHYRLEQVIELFNSEHVKVIKGGNVLDYVCAYLKATGEDHNRPDAMRWLQTMLPTTELSVIPSDDARCKRQYKLLETEPVEDLALIRYLDRQAIPIGLAQKLLEEIYVRDLTTNRRFYALGFKNDDGGYIFANPLLEGTLGPQTVSFQRNTLGVKSNLINIFVNFTDMLSAFTRFPETYREQDSICLNGLDYLKHAFGYITGYGYRTVCTWMPSGNQGSDADAVIRLYANTQRGLTHKRMSFIYPSYADVAAWHRETVDVS